VNWITLLPELRRGVFSILRRAVPADAGNARGLRWWGAGTSTKVNTPRCASCGMCFRRARCEPAQRAAQDAAAGVRLTSGHRGAPGKALEPKERPDCSCLLSQFHHAASMLVFTNSSCRKYRDPPQVLEVAIKGEGSDT
jgi:hypothetical protein